MLTEVFVGKAKEQHCSSQCNHCFLGISSHIHSIYQYKHHQYLLNHISPHFYFLLFFSLVLVLPIQNPKQSTSFTDHRVLRVPYSTAFDVTLASYIVVIWFNPSSSRPCSHCFQTSDNPMSWCGRCSCWFPVSPFRVSLCLCWFAFTSLLQNLWLHKTDLLWAHMCMWIAHFPQMTFSASNFVAFGVWTMKLLGYLHLSKTTAGCHVPLSLLSTVTCFPGQTEGNSLWLLRSWCSLMCTTLHCRWTGCPSLPGSPLVTNGVVTGPKRQFSRW